MDGSNGTRFLARVLRTGVRSAPGCRTWIRGFEASEAPAAEPHGRFVVSSIEFAEPTSALGDSRSRHRKLISFRVSEKFAEWRSGGFSGVSGSGSVSVPLDGFPSNSARDFHGRDEVLVAGLHPCLRDTRRTEGIGTAFVNGIPRHAACYCVEAVRRRYDQFYSEGRTRHSSCEELDGVSTAGGNSFANWPFKRAGFSRSIHVKRKAREGGRDHGSLSSKWETEMRNDENTGLLTVENDRSSGQKSQEDGSQNSALVNGQAVNFTPSKVIAGDIPVLEHGMGEQASRRASEQVMALLQAALDEADDEQRAVPTELQRSLSVGVVGAPNAGKSLLTNQLVGTRVSAVSPKTNTTHREHLGVCTKDETQLLFYDTPGLHLAVEGTPLRVDVQHRVRNAWDIVDFCDALVVLVDAERQIRRPDKRVLRLVEKLGSDNSSSQKRVLCLNKVDMIEQKRQLLPLAKQFEDLLGYERIFMISGKTGSGVADVKDFLVEQAVLRPWESDPQQTDQRDVALEVVREHVFDKLHEELPHTTKQKLVSWKVLKDGSIRIQQLLLVPKKEHQKILVGTNGAVIGEIGIKARKELQEILGSTVHLILDVKAMTV